MFGAKQRKINELEQILNAHIKMLAARESKIQSLLARLQEYENQEVKTLKEIRSERGMTQKQVAEGIGIKSAQYISEIERGIHIPSFKFICKLAYLYELTPAQIVESLTIDGWGVSDEYRK